MLVLLLAQNVRLFLALGDFNSHYLIPPPMFDKEAVPTKIVQSPRVSLISSLGRRQRKIQTNEGEAGKLLFLGPFGSSRMTALG